MSELSQLPSAVHTLPERIRTPGATPLYVPSEAAPEPATVEVTWVPWPFRSSVFGSVVKFADSVTRPLRSGWLGS